MGSGKTTVGTLLARQLAWRFVDLDQRIEESAGLKIPEIFERLGEPAFRQIEADQLRAALGRASEHKEGAVLALGGGTYAQPGCPDFLRASNAPLRRAGVLPVPRTTVALQLRDQLVPQAASAFRFASAPLQLASLPRP